MQATPHKLCTTVRVTTMPKHHAVRTHARMDVPGNSLADKPLDEPGIFTRHVRLLQPASETKSSVNRTRNNNYHRDEITHVRSSVRSSTL